MHYFPTDTWTLRWQNLTAAIWLLYQTLILRLAHTLWGSKQNRPPRKGKEIEFHPHYDIKSLYELRLTNQIQHLISYIEWLWWVDSCNKAKWWRADDRIHFAGPLGLAAIAKEIKAGEDENWTSAVSAQIISRAKLASIWSTNILDHFSLNIFL